MFDEQPEKVRILQAASELFEVRGYGVAVEEIAAHAGTDKTAVQHHFHDRYDLASDVLAVATTNLLFAIINCVGSDAPIEEILRHVSIISAFDRGLLDHVDEETLNGKYLLKLSRQAEGALRDAANVINKRCDLRPKLTVADVRAIGQRLGAALATLDLPRAQAKQRAIEEVMAELSARSKG